MDRESFSFSLSNRMIAVAVCLGMIYAALTDTAAMIFAASLITVGSGLIIVGLARWQGGLLSEPADAPTQKR